jgi:GDPmannose 4,6-dehydratase
MAFLHVGFHLDWVGEGIDEVGVLKSIDSEKYMQVTGNKIKSEIHSLINQELVKVDPKYFRPTEVELLIGDPTKSNTKLGWTPEYDLKGLVNEMMEYDLKLFQKDIHLTEFGHEVLKQVE